MKKVFIVMQDAVVNTTGGAITSFIKIANFLSDNFEVYGICYAKQDGKPNLNDDVKFINLYHYYDGKKSFSEAINQFTEDIKPDIIIFFFAYLYADAKLSEKFNEIPRMLLFRSRPDFYFAVHKNTKFLEDMYVNTVSQVQFQSYRKLLPEYIKRGNVVCIPNPTKPAIEYINSDIEHKKIIYLSRIDCWKGQEFLIRSFELIASKYKDWSVDIYGQSQPESLELELKKLVKSLHLEDQIHFCGVTKEPFKTYLNYDICAFPSLFEGFPNGLSEPLSVGLPAVGLKGASGVNELIIDGKNGFLAEYDYKDFADKIEILINDRNLRKQFSNYAIDLMKQYDASKIKEMWNETVQNIIDKKYVERNEDKQSSGCNYELFPIDMILSMQDETTKFRYNNFGERIFSIKNNYSDSGKKKVITILGIKISIGTKIYNS